MSIKCGFVSDFPNWKRIVFERRVLLQTDKSYYGELEWKGLESLPVLTANGEDLFVFNGNLEDAATLFIED